MSACDDTEFDWSVECDANGSLTRLTFGVRTLRNVRFEDYHPQLSMKLASPLLRFKNMTQLDLVVYGGKLPPQLGALPHMQFFNISHYCLGGSLPPNWLQGWPELIKLNVAPHQDAFGIVPEDAQCGVTGPIPLRWQHTQMKALGTVKLHNNRLLGFLPSLENWTTCCDELDLAGNEFVGPVPQRWSAQKGLVSVKLQNNKLEGKSLHAHTCYW
jgi:hypothetical protein